jgi:hypothetical protein
MIYSRRALRLLDEGPEVAWQSIHRVFATSDALYDGRTFADGRLTNQAAILHKFVTYGKEAEHIAIRFLDDKSPLVGAYCLLALRDLRSSVLWGLPATLLKREEEITWRAGSFFTKIRLGDLAIRMSQLSRNAKI